MDITKCLVRFHQQPTPSYPNPYKSRTEHHRNGELITVVFVQSMSLPNALTYDSRTGTNITEYQARRGVYIWTVPNPLYFTVLQHQQRPFFYHNLRTALNLHKGFLTFKIWTTLNPSTNDFSQRFRFNALRYLDELGVISIINVIHVVFRYLYSTLRGTTVQCEQYLDIQYSIY